jgi:hypothetical protein
MNKLTLHPTAHASAAASLHVSADATVSNGILHLKYEVQAGKSKVVWPLATESVQRLGASHRRDELWKSTCLEAFLLKPDGSYHEINLAPEGAWNVYSFNSYREGMRTESSVTEVFDFNSTFGQLSAKLDLSALLKSPLNFRLGLTAVIETEGGERSYWSLKHSSEKPDFHDSRGHILEMRI